MLAAPPPPPPATRRDLADGTPIVTSFHPAEGLAPGSKAPTILVTHGWGGNRDADGTAPTSEATGNVGAAPLRKAGFNVLTWDSRGFGQSGGTVTVDYKDNEGRDVQALIDYLAKQPEALLDGPGDPRVGMHGGSYARRDRARRGRHRAADRRDRARHRLALAADRALQGGHRQGRLGGPLYAPACRAAGGRRRPGRPADRQPRPAHHLRVRLRREHRQALRRGPRLVRLARARRSLVDAIRVPTLLVQGTADTLFTLDEAIDELPDPARQRRPRQDGLVLRRARHVPDRRRRGRARRARRDRLDEALPGAGHVGRHRPALRVARRRRQVALGGRLPAAAGAPLVAEGAGRLAINPADAVSGSPVAAGRAANAVNVAGAGAARRRAGRRRADAEAHLHGDRRASDGYAFAQIVDETRGVVRRQPGAPDPARARRQAAHDRAAAGGDRGEPHAAVEARRSRSPAAARSTGRPARRPTCRSPRRGWRSRPSERAAAAAACCRDRAGACRGAAS